MAFVNRSFRRVMPKIPNLNFLRYYADPPASAGSQQKKGLVLGVYEEGETGFKFTSSASSFNKQTGGRLEELLKEAGGRLKKGKVQVYHNLDPEYFTVALAGVGEEDVGLNTQEYMDEAKENVRVAAGAGALALRKTGVDHIMVEGFNEQVEAAAEGSCLAVWRYQDYKAKDDQKIVPTLDLYNDPDKTSWLRGINKAEAQNLARKLSDAPPNQMTPSLFSQAAVEVLCPCGVTVEIRDKEWIESKNMNAFLAAARGSCELPILLELGYCGGGTDDKPIVLVGKGVTFDSGGLCLKKCKGMMEYRADMAAGAAIVAALRAIAMLNLPINVTGIIPLMENMPSGLAVKPGDVVTASNGRTIIVDNTDHEGHLCMADALLYGVNQFKPKLVMDIATMSGGMRTAINCAASGAFCSNDSLWQELKKSGAITGDRVWRFPLWNLFSTKITPAAFLREFVPCGDWIHLDISGSGMLQCKKDVPYLVQGRMTGRPTRTLIQFLTQMVNYDPSKEKK
ncbi:Cytosol aminopeptidase [Blattella germanica]|nr:Cytosol aminopeptidase [Blattella germanica]